MASLNKRSDGTYFVEFILNDRRKTVSVGRAQRDCARFGEGL